MEKAPLRRLWYGGKVGESCRLRLGGLRQEVVQKAKGYGALPSHRMDMVVVTTGCKGLLRMC